MVSDHYFPVGELTRCGAMLRRGGRLTLPPSAVEQMSSDECRRIFSAGRAFDVLDLPLSSEAGSRELQRAMVAPLTTMWSLEHSRERYVESQRHGGVVLDPVQGSLLRPLEHLLHGTQTENDESNLRFFFSILLLPFARLARAMALAGISGGADAPSAAVAASVLARQAEAVRAQALSAIRGVDSTLARDTVAMIKKPWWKLW
jgi:hypothetical protein